eukprot:TRINITY_DN4763_c0_g1_i1.p1 TRINITY_DN4763_c0_g1~~TRINITY_DN4763_c0_g1_i1.p1  ORF type:complete len:1107 (+),score=297.95 TRINITY_DN4763_c0_g1_i1:423-3323(+)
MADVLLILLNAAAKPLLTAIGHVMHGADAGGHLTEVDGRVRWERGSLPEFLHPLERTIASTGGTVQDIVRIDPRNPIFQRPCVDGDAVPLPSLLGLARPRGGTAGILAGIKAGGFPETPLLRGIGVRVSDAVGVADAIKKQAQARADRVAEAARRAEDVRKQKDAREARRAKALEEEAQRRPAVPPEWPGSHAYRRAKEARQLAKKRDAQAAQREMLDTQVEVNNELKAAQAAADAQMEMKVQSPRFTAEEIADAKAALLAEYMVKMQAAEARHAELQRLLQLHGLEGAPPSDAQATAQTELAALAASVQQMQHELAAQTTALEGQPVADVAMAEATPARLATPTVLSVGDQSMAADSEATEKQVVPEDQVMSLASGSPMSADSSHPRTRYRIPDHDGLLAHEAPGGGSPPAAHPRHRHRISDQPDLLKWEVTAQRRVLKVVGPKAVVVDARERRCEKGPVSQKIGAAGGVVFEHQKQQPKRRIDPSTPQAGRPAKQRCLPALLTSSGGPRTLYSPGLGLLRCSVLPRQGMDDALVAEEAAAVEAPDYRRIDIYAGAKKAAQLRRQVAPPELPPPKALDKREGTPEPEPAGDHGASGLSTIARLDALYRKVRSKTDRQDRGTSPSGLGMHARKPAAASLASQRAPASLPTHPPTQQNDVKKNASGRAAAAAGVRVLDQISVDGHVPWGGPSERAVSHSAFVEALPSLFSSYRQKAPEALPVSVWPCVVPLAVGFECTLQRAVLHQQQEVDRAIQTATLEKARLGDTLAVLHAVYLALDSRFSNEVADVIDAAAAGRLSTANARNRIQLALHGLKAAAAQDISELTALYAVDVLSDICVSSGGQAAQAGRSEHAEVCIALCEHSERSSESDEVHLYIISLPRPAVPRCQCPSDGDGLTLHHHTSHRTMSSCSSRRRSAFGTSSPRRISGHTRRCTASSSPCAPPSRSPQGSSACARGRGVTTRACVR